MTTKAVVAGLWLASSTSKSSQEFPFFSGCFGSSHSPVASSTGRWTYSSLSPGSPPSVCWSNGPTARLATETRSTGTKSASTPSVADIALPKPSHFCLPFSGSSAPLLESGSSTARGARPGRVMECKNGVLARENQFVLTKMAAILADDGTTAAVSKYTEDVNERDDYWKCRKNDTWLVTNL